ncbi:hypothetical protein MKW98_001548 [Papaver atlanticum]|uniref:SWIM-type domain-containing protein n=1 Tax=Papaver atlanticum TaxID=357466 RepID=A0AAD4S8V6_9MAGN|nr:hypothetical protein MKW98_001548 [Papaver atlanticum]
MFVGKEWGSYKECRDYIKDKNIYQNFYINVYCSRIWDKVTFRCKDGYFEHTCKTTHGINNPLAKARWVFRVMLDAFKAHPKYKPKDLKAEVKRVHSVEISYWTAWHMCMERIFGKKLQGESYPDGGVVPRAEEIYKMNMQNSSALEIVPTSRDVWTILDHRNGCSWVVTLSKHQCSCRFWDVTGIPCEHAINASFFNRNANWKELLDEYHFVDKYRATYAGMVGPMDNVCKWKSKEEIEHKMRPPPYERQKGRPRTERRRDANEARGGNGQRKQCKLCIEFGHNKRGFLRKAEFAAAQGNGLFSLL